MKLQSGCPKKSSMFISKLYKLPYILFNYYMDRFTLCLEDGLLEKLDGIVAERGYPSRSQAMADFIRRAIVKKEFRRGASCVGTVSIMYDAGRKSPAAELEDVLVANSKLIVSQQTVFINRKSALLVIAVLGRPVELQEFADSLRAVKGVTHGSFSIVSDM